MDATTRWETEALRKQPPAKKKPPKPTSKSSEPPRNWVTLKEAEAATGIPSNTLRKWVRKAGLPSYLESDGDLALRMVDLVAIRARAKELGRDDTPAALHEESSPARKAESGERKAPPSGERTSDPAWPAEGESVAAVPEGTMLVPVDAWNKMLAQLGNLHEAGQQLAEARERAAKAETEAEFLRERLGEIREQSTESDQATESTPAPPSVGVSHMESQKPKAKSQKQSTQEPPAPGTRPTTTYWRYVTTGWRARRKR